MHPLEDIIDASDIFVGVDEGDFVLDDYRRWETRYTLIAVVHTFILGAWFPVCVLTGNAFTEFVSIAFIFGNLIGVCGRCFPIARLVNAQILAVGFPIIGGLL